MHCQKSSKSGIGMFMTFLSYKDKDGEINIHKSNVIETDCYRIKVTNYSVTCN